MCGGRWYDFSGRGWRGFLRAPSQLFFFFPILPASFSLVWLSFVRFCFLLLLLHKINQISNFSKHNIIAVVAAIFFRSNYDRTERMATMDGLGLSWLQTKKIAGRIRKGRWWGSIRLNVKRRRERKKQVWNPFIERLPDHLPGYTNDNNVLVTTAQIDGIKQRLL